MQSPRLFHVFIKSLENAEFADRKVLFLKKEKQFIKFIILFEKNIFQIKNECCDLLYEKEIEWRIDTLKKNMN